MAKRQQTNDELLQQLEEQLSFIDTSSNEFDKENFSEAKRLATNIRILLHDTGSSTSLLQQLGYKNKIYYRDSATDYDPRNLMSHHGLVGLKISNNHSSYYAGLSERDYTFKTFETWWNKVIIVDKNKKQFTRKKLVLALANQDGGAHVDPELDKAYDDLSRNNSVGWVHSNGTDSTPILKIELFSIRQIAYELVSSIEDYIK